MTKLPLLVVCGATGTQGRAIVDHFLSRQSPPQVRIRSLVRNKESKGAQEIEKLGAELFLFSSLMDTQTLTKAFEGATAVYAYTIPQTDGTSERSMGQSVVDAIAQCHVQPWLLWQTGADAYNKSGGKYAVSTYDEKAAVQKYAVERKMNATFVFLGAFLENWISYGWLQLVSDNAIRLAPSIFPVDRCFPLVSIEHDLGKIVEEVLVKVTSDDDKGKSVLYREVDPSFAWMTWNKVGVQIAKAMDVEVTVKSWTEEELAQFLPNEIKEETLTLMRYISEFTSITEEERDKLNEEERRPHPLLKHRAHELDSIPDYAKRVLKSWLNEQRRTKKSAV